MTAPAGNSVLFPRPRVSGKLNSLFPLEPVIECLLLQTVVLGVAAVLAGNICNEHHWKLVNIVLMVAKLGSVCFGSQMLSTGSKNVFDLRQRHFLVSELKNVFPQHLFPTQLNWKRFASQQWLCNNVSVYQDLKAFKFECFVFSLLL